MMFDPIADMLTRIRNANKNCSESVKVSHSKTKEEIAKILKEEGYIADYFVQKEKGKKFNEICMTLKYNNNAKVISGLNKISKPGLRVYVKSTNIPKVLSGLGIAVISTSQGLMTGEKAREKDLGGEVIAFIW